jgi:hypothetical protein
VLPQTDDPVTEHFLPLDLLPWGQIEERGWARVGSIPPDAWFNVTVDTTYQPWAKRSKPVADTEGAFYDISMHLRGSGRRYFDFQNFLENTRKLHKHIVYICPDNRLEVIRVVIPAVLGEKLIIEILETMIEMARASARPGEWPNFRGDTKQLVEAWPEYVLDPDHALSMLTKDMPCSIFQV